MRTNKMNIGIIVCLIGMLMMIFSAVFIPARTVSAANNCSVTLECTANSKAVSGIDWSAYRIGSRDPYGGFVLEGDFKNYPVSLNDTSSTAIANAAYTLETYALTDNLKPDRKGKTDSHGSITFSGLSEGIYLLFSGDFSDGNYKYECQPSIIELGGFADNNVVVKPKITATKIPKPEKTKYSVRKVWLNESAENVRPASISAELYKNGKLDKTVVLNSSNGWYYEWTSDKSSSWRVVEKSIPSGYSVEYTKDKTAFLIKNIYNSEKPTEPTSSTETEPSVPSSEQPPTGTTSVTTTVTTPVTTLPPREELEREIEEGDDFNEHDYTPESWKEYQEILKRAKLILGSSDSTEEEILQVLEELRMARRKLILAYLPQTGQLWWPVPVLAGGGLVLIAAGVRLNKKKGNKDDDK